MNTQPDQRGAAKTSGPAPFRLRGGFFRRLFGPTKAELIDALNITERSASDSTARSVANRQRAERAEAELSVLRASRNVSWPRPATRIPPHVILKEFNVPLDQGLMAALHQELDDQIQELLDVVSQPPSATLTAEQRLHLAGGIEHLRLFQKDLLDRTSVASTADKDLEEDKEGE